MSTPSLTVRRGALADALDPSLALNLALVLGAAALVGALAQVSIPLGFTPVPLTGQTLGVLLAGAALGWRRAGTAMGLYVLGGLAGVPWFAGHAHGAPGATFGYLIGFVAAASVTGALAQAGQDRTVLRAGAAMLVGTLIIYAFGVTWLAAALHVSLGRAISLGLVPFVAGDLIKAAVAGLILPSAWRLVGHRARP